MSPIRVAIFCTLIAAFIAVAFALKHNSQPQLVVPAPTKVAPSLPATSINQLPPHVLSALKSLCGGCTFADSDGDWQSTDVVMADLPERRVTDIQHVGDTWEIRYERGGFARRTYTLLLSSGSQPTVMSSSSCTPKPGAECSW